MIDNTLLDQQADFIRRVAHAKMRGEPITASWFRREVLGLTNAIEAEPLFTANYSNDATADVAFTLHLHGVNIALTLAESIIVVNGLARLHAKQPKHERKEASWLASRKRRQLK